MSATAQPLELPSPFGRGCLSFAKAGEGKHLRNFPSKCPAACGAGCLLTEKELIFGRWLGALIASVLGGYIGWTVGFYQLMSWALRDSSTDQPGLGLIFCVTGAFGAIWGASALGFLVFVIRRKLLDWFNRTLSYEAPVEDDASSGND